MSGRPARSRPLSVLPPDLPRRPDPGRLLFAICSDFTTVKVELLPVPIPKELGYRRQDQPRRDYDRREQGMHLSRGKLSYHQEATGHQHGPGNGARDEIPVPGGAEDEDGPHGPEKGNR